MGLSRSSTRGSRPIAKRRPPPEISGEHLQKHFGVGRQSLVENWRAGRENASRKTAPRTGFVTFTQQLPAFCRLRHDSPKKAAVATVFGLPRRPVTGLNLPVIRVKTHVDRDRSRTFGLQTQDD